MGKTNGNYKSQFDYEHELIEKHKFPEKHIPYTFAVVFMYITEEFVEDDNSEVYDVEVYEFEFFDFKGNGIWNYLIKFRNRHEAIKHIIEIKKQCRNDLVIIGNFADLHKF